MTAARRSFWRPGSCAVCRRQTDGEAGPRRSVVAVVHVDLPIMAFDDCLGDRKAQAGMPAEILSFRPYGVESVKDRFPRFGRNSRTLVVDADFNLVAHSRRGDLDQPAGRREAHRIIEDIVDGP